MTLEQYNQLPYDYAHCAGTHCEKASQCLRHTASRCSKRVDGSNIYMMVNSKVIANKQPCPFFDPNSKERFTWGILRIYDNVRLADLSDIQQNLIYTFGHTVYYLIKRKERVLTESKPKGDKRHLHRQGLRRICN